MRHLSTHILLSFILSLGTLVLSQTNSSALPVGSCTPDIPCSNGACCNGDSGFCGFGPSFCKTVAQGGPCTSNCDALAECGPFAAAQNLTCPLNVCCSQFGFCGTTAEFCENGCQSNCSPPGPASCGADQQSALHRRIGYYEGWAATRACAYTPEMISAETLTHINFAFALISNSFTVIEMSPGDAALWTRTTALKKQNVALKVFLSIGGWSFNDPPTQNIFSQLVGSDANTATFISSVLSVMQAYGFDGIDVDWEYPAAFDRGGSPADKDNYVTFMSKVKTAFTPRAYGLTFTAPSSYWYLQHFDLPNLMKYADWVNVMTYDLHGTWDGVDPYIGAIVLAHTNLTEIEMTLSLFNNVGIDPSQIVLGIGFYGRSFQLSDPGCSSPGCAFVGGADPGPCSANSGTLMFSEIETIISQNALEPTFDEAAAVKYIVWNDNQWVSYDDSQTLQMKLNFANSRCLGGTMIWSVDQDDMQYTALSGLYPDIDVNQPSVVESGDQCSITGCGQSCPTGWDTLTTLTTNPGSATSCDPKTPAKLCCPSGNSPQNCSWRGGGGSTCNPTCAVGEITLATDPVGGDGKATCAQGTKAFCCQTGQNDPTGCHATGCGESNTACASGDAFLTFVRQGTEDNGSCEAQNSDPNVINKQPCPDICSTNNKPVCCEASVISAYTNCHWVGDLPNCLNSACPAGQVGIFDDMQGDASQSCVGNGRRLYCCNPPANDQFLPVPEQWVLPSLDPTPGGSLAIQPATFTVDFDDNIGPSDPNQTGAGTSGISDDGKENDSPFGEVFISSPNPGSVSSLDLASDWVIQGCDRSSDQAQEVLAYCSKSLKSDDSGCGHVFIGQAEHTVVRLPTTCGVGPYARIVSLAPHEDQSVLPAHIRRSLPENELVYALKFDYNFAAIPDANGPILMRADVTDMPGYWDEMINSPPDDGTTSTKRSNSKREFHQPEGLERRWFGPFDRWLQKLNTVTSSNGVSRNFHWSDTYTIFHQEESCPNFSSSLDISVTGTAQANSRFGYYLEATIVPPAIQQCYVYLNAGASAQATFKITGLAEAHFGTERAEIISFGFPGLYYPGLLTLGPSLHLYGELTGKLSMSGTYSASVGYEFPSLDLSFGKQDKNNDEENASGPVNPNANNNGFDYGFGYNVALEGNVEAHLVPSLQLGLSVLGGAVLDAQVFVEADIYAGVGITGSVSNAVAPNICVNPYFGVDLNAGLTGSVLFWRDNALSYNFYSNQFPFGGGCFTSQQEVDGGGNSRRDALITGGAASGDPLQLSHRSIHPAYSAYEGEGWVDLPTSPISVTTAESSSLSKRGGIPFLPGNLFCPDVGTSITGSTAGSDCFCYSDASATDPESQTVSTKRSVIPDGNGTFSEGPFHVLDVAKLKSCGTKSINIPPYQNTPIIAYYDLENPASLDPTMGSWVPSVPVDLGNKKNGVPYLSLPSGGGSKAIYAREHPYEVSMSSLFADYLETQTDLWLTDEGDNAWCTWVDSNLQRVPAYNPPAWNGRSIFSMIGTCYPSNAAGTPMAVFEQDANVIKNTALYAGIAAFNHYDVQPVRKDDVFTDYCPQKQIAVLRAAAGVASFLNEYEVSSIFIEMNDCVYDLWTTWAAAYQDPNSGVDAPNRDQVNIGTLYDNWVRFAVSNVPVFLRQQITHLITLYNSAAAGATATVDLSWPVLLDTENLNKQRGGQDIPVVTDASVYSQGVQVTQAMLTAQILNQIPDISWIHALTH